MQADVLVLFGATGDLAKKKLFPALYEMEEAGELEIPVFCVASSKWTQEEFRKRVESSIRERIMNVNETVLKNLLDEMQLIIGDYNDVATFEELREAIKRFELPVTYLAIAPDMFQVVMKGLSAVGLTSKARVVVEKPFGRDLQSAQALDESLKGLLAEDQI